MCRVTFPTFISTSRRSNPALSFRLPSLEVTAGCVRSERAGRHTNVHAGPLGRLGLLPAAQWARIESRSQRRAVSPQTLPSGCTACAFFPFAQPPIDRRHCSHAEGRERREARRRRGGGEGGVRLFVLLHLATCERSNCILMRNNAEVSRDD